eukprot:TRINITY_DN1657_c0_g1_i2.p1 TRINITY_DN1657_c0_g1~~TRINITY_DN1657_c0_g1_i2.p1  ORF type:complete len:262 (+),score=64.80 TRINITY_DN1657_c0_g1_i2:363-1148(+)
MMSRNQGMMNRYPASPVRMNAVTPNQTYMDMYPSYPYQGSGSGSGSKSDYRMPSSSGRSYFDDDQPTEPLPSMYNPNKKATQNFFPSAGESDNRDDGPPVDGLYSSTTYPSANDDFQSDFKSDISRPKSNVQTSTWVTLFGIPPSDQDWIIDEFRKFGNIVDVEKPRGGCFWVHLQYASDIQATKAMTKSGTTYRNFIVGVMPRTEQRKAETMSDSPKSEESIYHYQPVNPSLAPFKTRTDTSVQPQRSVISKFMNYVVGI